MMVSIAVSAYSSNPSLIHIKKALEVIDTIIDCLKERTWFVGGYRGLMKNAVDHLVERGEKVILIVPLEYEKEGFPDEAAVVRTGMTFPGRNVVMVRSGDMLLALGGAVGSIMEVITAVEMGKDAFVVIGTGLPTDGLPMSFPGPVIDERKGGRIFYIEHPYVESVRRKICTRYS
jgi:uncharacterized protein (TIGR00725 family)